jgi:hypothetical protein
MIVTSASEWICTRIARRRHEFPVRGPFKEEESHGEAIQQFEHYNGRAGG